MRMWPGSKSTFETIFGNQTELYCCKKSSLASYRSLSSGYQRRPILVGRNLSLCQNIEFG